MISINWHEIPFVRISLPFIAGILVQQAWMSHWPIILSVGLTLGCIAALAALTAPHIRQCLRTAAICTLMFGIGALARNSVEPDAMSFYPGDEATVASVLTSEETEYGCRAQLRLIASRGHKADIIAFIRDTNVELFPRDTIIIAGVPSIIQPASNPFAFDFAQYYASQGIHHRIFAGPDDVIDIRPFSGFNLLRTCAIARARLSAIIEEHIDDPRSRGVLQAMTIGIRSDLDDDIYDAYAKSGAIHILAISGLHVGIISFLLFFLFGRVQPGDRNSIKVLRTVVLLAGIWSFAGIAGLSPSVTRAALMFSLYLIALNLKRKAQGLNILACTALICLAINPFQINSLSFQFSYLALLGILIFGKPLYQSVAIRSTIGRFIWGTIVLSISAQVFLIPLMIHYFHQVSLISLLSGVIAIPAAYVIVCAGLLLFSIHYISAVIAGHIGFGLDHFISLLNQAMQLMSEIPLSHVSDLYVHTEILWLLFILLVAIAVRQLTRWRLALRVSCIIAAAVVICQGLLFLPTSDIGMIAIYTNGEDIGFDYVANKICSSSVGAKFPDKYLANEIKSFRHAAGVKRIFATERKMEAKDLISQIKLPGRSPEQGYLIAFTGSTDNFNNQDSLPDCIVLNPGTSYSGRKAIEEFCLEHQIIFHDLSRQGTLYLTQTIKPQPHEKPWKHFKG